MALSNIFKEPRREITETVVGLGIFLAVAAPLVWGESCLWNLIRFYCKDTDVAVCLTVLCNVLFGVGVGLSVLLLMGIHQLGDSICTSLENRGVHLRPRVRRQ